MYFIDKHREYWQCQHCQLVYVPAQWHLSLPRERAEYDLHENTFEDQGYLQFLRRLGDPLLDRLVPNSRGLDVGCGPGPVLQKWLRSQGMQVEVYDKFYAPNQQVLLCQYDFVTATEVVEHLSAPGLSLMAMWQLVRSQGQLALMTKRVKSVEAFAGWHYKNDPTHIAFFSEASFKWLAGHWQAELTFADKDVVIFTKRT